MGLFGKKKDFWDEVDEASMETSEDSVFEESDVEEEVETQDDGRWHPTKCAPLKAFARLLMLASVVVLAVSGMIIYTYFNFSKWSLDIYHTIVKVRFHCF